MPTLTQFAVQDAKLNILGFVIVYARNSDHFGSVKTSFWNKKTEEFDESIVDRTDGANAIKALKSCGFTLEKLKNS